MLLISFADHTFDYKLHKITFFNYNAILCRIWHHRLPIQLYKYQKILISCGILFKYRDSLTTSIQENLLLLDRYRTKQAINTLSGLVVADGLESSVISASSKIMNHLSGFILDSYRSGNALLQASNASSY